MQDIVEKIRVRTKGRLVRPMMLDSSVYVINDFD